MYRSILIHDLIILHLMRKHVNKFKSQTQIVASQHLEQHTRGQQTYFHACMPFSHLEITYTQRCAIQWNRTQLTVLK